MPDKDAIAVSFKVFPLCLLVLLASRKEAFGGSGVMHSVEGLVAHVVLRLQPILADDAQHWSSQLVA